MRLSIGHVEDSIVISFCVRFDIILVTIFERFLTIYGTRFEQLQSSYSCVFPKSKVQKMLHET